MKGVEFNSPPTPLLDSALRAVAEHVSQIPPEHQAAVVVVATDAGFNAAFVRRVGTSFVVGAWAGKTWGSKIEGGGYVKASW